MPENLIVKPRNIRENLLYNTVRIEGLINKQPVSVGTGFFYRFSVSENNFVNLILTNRHVVADIKEFSFFLHELDNNNKQPGPSGKSISITIDDISSLWVPHPDPEIDLGAILFAPIEAHIKKELNKQIFYKTLDDSIIKSDEELDEISSVADDILMVGYPIGLWDQIANFPIIRKGISATHPAIDFERKSVGIADIACFPGSSGSPILIVKDGSYTDKKGNLTVGRKLLVLLGLLYAGPIHSEQGDIIIKEIPTKQPTVFNYHQMIHLGYYVKAKEIFKLCEHINEKHKDSINI